MALSIDYTTRVISVPKSYMTLIQSTPNEVRELPTNQFRLDLKDIEDSVGGMPFLDSHSHNTEAELGGIVYARLIEIINGYTITFEDGQYIVNLTGSNNNILDVTNLNQVSVRPSNAAGLISNSAIEYSSYNGGVTVDVLNGSGGTTFPVGTPQQPVSNMADALLIDEVRGFGTIYILGDYDFVGTDDYSNLTFIGESRERTEITIDTSVTMQNVEFRNLCFRSGILDGSSVAKDCEIINLNYVDGVIERCILTGGTVVLGNNAVAHFLDCWSGTPGVATPTIDMGGSGQSLALRNYNGGIKLINKTGTDAVSIDMASGQIKLAATVTNGPIICRGVGEISEDLSVGATVQNDMLNVANVADGVWDEEIADHVTSGTFGRQVGKKLLTVAKFIGLK